MITMDLLVVNGALVNEDNNKPQGEKPIYLGFQSKMCSLNGYRCTRSSVGMMPQSEGSRM